MECFSKFAMNFSEMLPRILSQISLDIQSEILRENYQKIFKNSFGNSTTRSFFLRIFFFSKIAPVIPLQILLFLSGFFLFGHFSKALLHKFSQGLFQKCLYSFLLKFLKRFFKDIKKITKNILGSFFKDFSRNSHSHFKKFHSQEFSERFIRKTPKNSFRYFWRHSLGNFFKNYSGNSITDSFKKSSLVIFEHFPKGWF